jgi:hypothetical protein
MLHDHTAFSPIYKGVAGMVASFSGVFISVMSQVEIILRVVGVGVGVACGIASLISIIRNMPPRKKP